VFDWLGSIVMSIAESYRAMSRDIRREAEKVVHEDARRAYLVLAEMWSRKALRLDGVDVTIDQSILEAIK
jgi:hypothetical protein